MFFFLFATLLHITYWLCLAPTDSRIIWFRSILANSFLYREMLHEMSNQNTISSREMYEMKQRPASQLLR